MEKSFIGVDISKKRLDVYIDSIDKHLQFDNTINGITKFLRKIKSLPQLSLIVCEPTGGYEINLIEMCLLKQVPIHKAHPNKIRNFAKASGIIAKTDKIDAIMIASYAKTFAAKHNVMIIDKELVQLRSLIERRHQLLKFINQETNRLEIPLNSILSTSIKDHVCLLEKELKKINIIIDQHISENVQIIEKVKLIESIPGVGRETATAILTELPEIKEINPNALKALVGVAPINRDSGNAIKKRSIYAGRSKVRKLLYMAAVSSTRSNRILRAFYLKLKSKGKPSKVALIAVASKILLLIQAILKNNKPFSYDYS